MAKTIAATGSISIHGEGQRELEYVLRNPKHLLALYFPVAIFFF
jgi:hypothetical protein